MKSDASSVEKYLSELPDDRREAISKVRDVILKNLPKGFEECMSYGMIGYVVPLSLYPSGYLNDKKTPLPLINLGSQKNHMVLHMMSLYSDSKLNEWFVSEYQKTGKKLDMGKGCVRFRKLDNLPLDLIGKTVAKTSVKGYIAQYEKSRKR